MPTDFESGTDTGYNHADSIEPVANAESANQTVFRRPSENIRERTEIVRKSLDDLWAVVSSDRGLTVASVPSTTVTWNGIVSGGGDGKFTISGDLRMVPLLSSDGITSDNNIPPRLLYDDGSSDYFSARSLLRIGDEGGNNLQLEIWEDGSSPGSPVVTVTGSTNSSDDYDPLEGPVLVRVQIDDGVHTWTEVVTAIDTHTDPTGSASVWIEPSVDAAVASNTAKVIAAQYLWEGADDIAGCDAQAYRVTQAEIATFFGSNVLAEGDVLMFDFISATQRLAQAGDTTLASALAIVNRDEADPPAGALSTAGHANIMNCIPICKVIDDRLHFLGGSVFEKATTGTIMVDATLRSDLADDDTATGDCGSEIVGSDVPAGSPTPRTYTKSDVYTQLGEMLVHYNDHVNANADQHPIKDIVEKQIYVVDSGGDGDFTTLQAAFDNADGNGGIYVLKGETFSENVTVAANFNKPTIFIGGHNGAVETKWITASANTPLLQSVNRVDAPVEFIGINFQYDGDSAAIDFNTAYALTARGYLGFKNCNFSRISTGHTYPFLSCGVNLQVEDSYFYGSPAQQTTIAPAVEVYNEQIGSSWDFRPNFTVKNCYFRWWRTLIMVGKSGAAETNTGKVEFSGNDICACGDVDSDTVSRMLTYTNSAYAQFTIENNRWEEKGGTSETDPDSNGTFCYLLGSGIISKNQLRRPLSGSTITSGHHVITVLCQGSADAWDVVDNILEPGELGGIEATGTQGTIQVRGNNIDFQPKQVNCIGIHLNRQGCDAVGNHITCTSAAVACHVIRVGDNGTRCAVRGNIITGISDDTVIPIRVTAGADDVVIESNHIIGTAINDCILVTGGAGTQNGLAINNNEIECPDIESVISVGSSDSLYVGDVHVCGNIIRSSGTGITTGGILLCGERIICTGNVLRDIADGAYGIKCIEGSGTVGQFMVADNVITYESSVASSSSVGILTDNTDDINISNNSIYRPYTGVDVTSGAVAQCTIQGNNIYSFTDHGIVIAGGQISVCNNVLMTSTVSAAGVRGIYSTSSLGYSVFSNNVIRALSAGMEAGIMLFGASSEVLEELVVSGNIIKNVTYGILLGATTGQAQRCTITGNTISGSSTTGIETDADYSAITGNAIYGVNSASDDGIIATADYIGISGNIIRNVAGTPITAAGAAAGMKNEAASGFILTHNNYA